MADKKKRRPRGKAATNPNLKIWLHGIAVRVKTIIKESKMKHAPFAKSVGISPETLTVVKKGKRNYGIDVLLPILASNGRDPVVELFEVELPSHDPRHAKLHEHLEACLQSKEYAGAATVVIEMSYEKMVRDLAAQKKK